MVTVLSGVWPAALRARFPAHPHDLSLGLAGLLLLGILFGGRLRTSRRTPLQSSFCKLWYQKVVNMTWAPGGLGTPSLTTAGGYDAQGEDPLVERWLQPRMR